MISLDAGERKRPSVGERELRADFRSAFIRVSGPGRKGELVGVVRGLYPR